MTKHVEKTPGLYGMKAICNYFSPPKSPRKILHLVRYAGFPAKKVLGEWVSHAAEIDAWERRCCTGKMPVPDAMPAREK